MREIYQIAVFITGMMIILFQLRQPFFGWICYPFAMIAFWAVMDICISPYVVRVLGIEWGGFYIVENITEQEYLPATISLFLWYFSVSMGMVFVGMLCRLPSNRLYPNFNKLQRKNVIGERKAFFKGGIFLSFLGLGINLALFAFFFNEDIVLSDIASLRLFYTASRELEGTKALIFGYLRMFSYFSQIGIIIMLFSCSHSVMNKTISLVFCFTQFILLSIYGGRESIILFGMAVFFSYQYAGPGLLLRKLLWIPTIMLASLLILNFQRLGLKEFTSSVLSLTQAIFSNHYAEDMAFAMDVFPKKLDWLYGRTVLTFLPGFFFPGVTLDWFENFYHLLVDSFGERSYYLSTGVHYSSAAEAYANFGLPGLLGLGILVGGIFGAIFQRQSRKLGDTIFTLFTIWAAVLFFSGLPTKISQAIGALGFFSLVPFAFVKAFALKEYRFVKRVGVTFLVFVLFYMIYRATKCVEFKFLSSLPLGIITVQCFRYVWMWTSHKKPLELGINGYMRGRSKLLKAHVESP